MAINRFINAQRIFFRIAKKELINKKKVSHWIWFIFPQLKSLGYSDLSNYYGIEDEKETLEYYNNRYLRHNMKKLIDIMLKYETNNLNSVVGNTDAMKIKSCMTLFWAVTHDNMFKTMLDKFYNGCIDEKTMILLNNKR